jgi:hypothetical protein
MAGENCAGSKKLRRGGLEGSASPIATEGHLLAPHGVSGNCLTEPGS